MANKEIQKKETSAVSVFTKKSSANTQLDKTDILIPKILLMQGPSVLVAEEKAQMGDIVNSVTAQLIGGKGKPITIIPLTHYKDIVKFEIADGDTKPKFKQYLPWNTQNAELPWEGVEKDMQGRDIKVKHMKRLNFYVLLESEMENPSALPYVLSFSSKSYQNGRKLVTHFAQADMANLEPCSYMFNLDSKKEKNDKGIFYIFDITPNKKTPDAFAPKISLWTDILAKGNHQVDDSDLETDATSEVPSQARSPNKGSQDTAQF